MNLRATLWIVGLAAGLPILTEAGMPMTLEQVAYRWRNDDGSEIGATWKAAVNTVITGVKRDENIRLRFAVWNTYDAEPLDPRIVGRIEYATSTNGPWVAVGLDPGLPFVMATTTGYTNGQPTTAQLPLSGSTLIPGVCVESPSNSGTANGSFRLGKYTNFEYCFQATAYANRNTTYYFRMTQLAGDPDRPDTFAYLQYAALTIEDTDPPPPADIYVDDNDENTAQIGAQLKVTFSGAIERKTDITDYLNPWDATCANPVGAWQGSSRFNSIVATDTNDIAFRWIPNVLVAAPYNVYARWTYDVRRSQYVPYTIRHAGGTSAEIVVNQRDPALAGKWNLLGTYTFNVGTNGWIEMSGNDGQACADAVWLHRVN